MAGSSADTTLVPLGATIGELEIVRQLGKGAMGAVFLARVRSSGERRAIKVMRDDCRGETDVARTRAEMAALLRLDHPALVRLRDFGELDVGPYVTMDYVAGNDLGAEVARHGPLAPAAAVRVLHRVAIALEYAHAQGTLHRDVKPSNVLMPGGDVDQTKLADVALTTILSPAMLSLRAQDEAASAPGFAAPERQRGDRELGRPADVYALGATAYVALAGKPPFGERPPVALLAAQLQDPPPRLSQLRPELGAPRLLEELLFACLARDADDRPHGDELVAHLGNLARQLGPPPDRALVHREGMMATRISPEESAGIAARLFTGRRATGTGDAARESMFRQVCRIVLDLAAALTAQRRDASLSSMVDRIRAIEEQSHSAESSLDQIDARLRSATEAAQRQLLAERSAQVARVSRLLEELHRHYRALFVQLTATRARLALPPRTADLFEDLDDQVERLRRHLGA